MSQQLKLGIPKGSLQKSTIDLFAQAGWNIQDRSRNYFPSIDDPEINCALVKPQEMAPFCADGTLDVGLTGYDWILEQNCEDKIHELGVLEYSKSSDHGCRWVVVVPKDSPIQKLEDLHGKKVATELINTTKRLFTERGVEAEIHYSWGATEAKVVEGLMDAVVEITETGSTIRAHGLRVVEDLLYTNTRMIASPEAMRDPWKRAKIEQLHLMLNASLKARLKAMIKLNVSDDNLEAVCQLLPSLHAPTVNRLNAKGWNAVETVVDRKAIRDLVPKLVSAGAEGIVEYDLKKVV
uniref:ATP phosphoribosyltransferase n=1 Tax=Magnetococcus massalia (strain MO-1) TaxID=451514 RepID=A0A1S7LJI7_MAGMO|nr:ATP phosphoribosyltransferase [Candidatus Magnetococcus massalia]